MNWRTELFPNHSAVKIRLAGPVFTIGSCFADEIGNRLTESKFQVAVNPFGTVYNPVSIHRLLNFGLTGELPSEESYGQQEEIYFNYHFHSAFSSLKKEELQIRLEEVIAQTNLFLKKAEWILITYGTAWVYKQHNETIVANCHKKPASHFTKQLLTDYEVLDSFAAFYTGLKTINPAAKLILTVSPVRHLKDSLELNSVSKSVLRMACHALVNQYPDVTYFPAYEILMDDLRDYRFYKKDLIHPTEEAIDYIWTKFAETYFDEPTKKIMRSWQHVKVDMAHRPFHESSKKHLHFLKSLLTRMESFQPMLNVDQEMAEIKARIGKHPHEYNHGQ
ncbi:MAG: GSCFA domain-containing protein [Bacteroidetes bacterium]|nr:GSCFA domain-containing protein [Bacteroidota bacterium]